MKSTERLEAVCEYLETEDIPLDQHLYVPLAMAAVCDEFREDGLYMTEIGGEVVMIFESMENEEALAAFFEIDEDTVVALFGTMEDPQTVEHVLSELQA